MHNESGELGNSTLYGGLKANRLLLPTWSSTSSPPRSLSETDLTTVKEEATEEHYQDIQDRLGLPKRRKSFLQEFTKTQKLSLMLLCVCNFFTFSTMSVIAPFFPNEALKKGMSVSWSAMVFSFFALIVFAMSPVIGKTIPMLGTKFTFLSGILVAGTCSILFGTLDKIDDLQTFTILCFVVRGVEAFGAACFSTASCTFVAEMFPHHVSSVMGILETFIGLGFSVGPAIGGVLYTAGGYELPFQCLGGCILVCIPIGMYLLPAPHTDRKSKKDGNVSFTKMISDPGVLMVCLVICMVSASWGAIDPTLSVHLQKFNLSATQIGMIFLLESGVYAIFSPIWGWISDRLHRTWTMMFVGLISNSIGFLLLGPAPFIPGLEDWLWLNLVALSWIGMSVALAFIPTYQTLLDNAVAVGCGRGLRTYSLVAGLWGSMYSLGDVIGPALGGLLLDFYGYDICMTVFAGIIFGVAMLIVLHRSCCKRKGGSSYKPVENGGPTNDENHREIEDSLISIARVSSPILYGSCEF